MTFDENETKTEDHTSYQPALRDILLLEVPIGVKVSPGGNRVAIHLGTTNWKEDRYDNVCHVYDLATGSTHVVNRTGNVKQLEWIDNQTLALLKQGSKDDDKAQVLIYEGLVGEGWAVTNQKTGVEWFKPFAGGLLFRSRDTERDENKARTERFGKFTHFEQEISSSALYYVGLAELRQYQAEMKAATVDQAKELVPPKIDLSRLMSEPLSIQEVIPSPTNDAVYINCWKRDDLVYYRDTSSFRISLDASSALAEHIRREKVRIGQEKDSTDKSVPEGKGEESEDVSYLGEITRLNLPPAASVVGVSPDGNRLLVAHQERDSKMYTHRDLHLIELEMALQAPDAAEFLAEMRNISASLDRYVMAQYWTEAGIFGAFVDGTCIRVAHFGENGKVTPIDIQSVFLAGEFHVSMAGRIGLVGANAQAFPEVYLAEPPAEGTTWQVNRLSNFGRLVDSWDLGTVETVSWKSKDGTEIEGVLRKPAGFDPARKYPLVFIVHGGPQWFSEAYLLPYNEMYYYPGVQFVNKDVLVLKPNYRGSIGRGQMFCDLNVNNLGVGDLWDLESGIESLAELGWVDEDRIGCMGWSQGGYISAFAAIHSDKFRAVSVGAGVSDWYTYHIGNDIPEFTVDYLSGSPFRDRDLYFKTSPISNIANAKTPMLIQHGWDDRRVPVSNAMELYRGLKEMGVPVELFVFPNMGHPITKPRENHAIMHQNLAWFSHYLLDEELELE